MTDQLLENRARLRQEERMVHKLQKEQVSLKSALSDKHAELEGLQRTADPQHLEEMQAEIAKVERSSKQLNEEVSSHRKQLGKLQVKLDQEQEVLDALQRRLVRVPLSWLCHALLAVVGGTAGFPFVMCKLGCMRILCGSMHKNGGMEGCEEGAGGSRSRAAGGEGADG